MATAASMRNNHTDPRNRLQRPTPRGFHVKECLGTITECTGFETNFKDEAYIDNKANAEMFVLSEPMKLGLCYKLVDIEWCAQLHPDP